MTGRWTGAAGPAFRALLEALDPKGRDQARWELETGAKVGAFRYLTAEAVERSAVEVGMKYGATFQISLGEGTAAEGKPMLPFLDECRDRVWTVAMHAKVWAGHHRRNLSPQEP